MFLFFTRFPSSLPSHPCILMIEGVSESDLPFLPGPRQAPVGSCAKIRGGEDLEVQQGPKTNKQDRMSSSQQKIHNHPRSHPYEIKGCQSSAQQSTTNEKATFTSQKLSPVGYLWMPKVRSKGRYQCDIVSLVSGVERGKAQGFLFFLGIFV